MLISILLLRYRVLSILSNIESNYYIYINIRRFRVLYNREINIAIYIVLSVIKLNSNILIIKKLYSLDIS